VALFDCLSHDLGADCLPLRPESRADKDGRWANSGCCVCSRSYLEAPMDDRDRSASAKGNDATRGGSSSSAPPNMGSDVDNDLQKELGKLRVQNRDLPSQRDKALVSNGGEAMRLRSMQLDAQSPLWTEPPLVAMAIVVAFPSGEPIVVDIRPSEIVSPCIVGILCALGIEPP